MISNNEEEHHRKNYLISVDGSDHSNWGFDLIFEEFFKKGDHITLLHVTNPNKSLSDIPFHNQPDQIMSIFETKLLGKLPQEKFLIMKKPRENDNEHALEVVFKTAKIVDTNLIIIGIQGHKGIKKKDYISKGIMFMVKYITIPSLVIKEHTQREKKENKGFTWLVCMEDHFTRSFKVFEFVTTLIDKEKDTIIGYNLFLQNEDKELEDNFEKICVKMNIQKRRFLSKQKNPKISIGKSICDVVNFGDDFIDFVSIGHNMSKYDEVASSPTIEIIKYAQANILFSSRI